MYLVNFNNALLYNPKIDQANGWAKTLLSRFEDLFRLIQENIYNEQREYFGGDVSVLSSTFHYYFF